MAGQPGLAVGIRVGRHAFAGIVGTERDADARHRRLVAQDAHDHGQDRRRGLAGGERATHLEQRPRFALAGLRDLRARPLDGDELADDDPDEQQDDEVQPLVRVVDRERVQRQDEQEVVQHERRDGRDDRAPRPGDERRRDDGGEVDRRGVLEARRLEQRDRQRGERERRRGHGHEPYDRASIDPLHHAMLGVLPAGEALVGVARSAGDPG